MPLVDDPEASDLIVFRLRPDGTSCVINSVLGSNEEAREIADSTLSKFKCIEEPQLR
jgi:hypothetical protein